MAENSNRSRRPRLPTWYKNVLQNLKDDLILSNNTLNFYESELIQIENRLFRLGILDIEERFELLSRKQELIYSIGKETQRFYKTLDHYNHIKIQLSVA